MSNSIIRFSNKQRLEKIIKQCKVCQVAMVDGDRPYQVTMNFGYKDKVIYLHSGKIGKKFNVLRKNNNVSVMFYTDTELFAYHEQIGCSWRMRYKSVMAYGKLTFIEDFEEKKAALFEIMKTYTQKEVKFSKPAIDNVFVMKVAIEQWTGRSFEHPNEIYEIE